jgi:hypothetical protein
MPFGSTMQSVATAGAVSAGVAIAVGVAVNTCVVQKFRALTPQTWRADASAANLRAVVSRLLVGVGFPLAFAYTGLPMLPAMASGSVPRWQVGLQFGGLLWLAMALPIVLSLAATVNVHRGFVVGKVVDWLIVAAASGVACAYLIKPA